MAPRQAAAISTEANGTDTEWRGPPGFPQPAGFETPPNEFSPALLGPAEPAVRQRPDYVAMLSALMDILNARLLLLLALVAISTMGGYAVYAPDPLRSWTVGGFAVAVLWPLVWLNKR